MPNEHYNDFIRDTFIGAIRSVLIIDDDYPTFEEILSSGVEEPDDGKRFDKGWRQDPARYLATVDKFRKHDPPLLVDIDDGSQFQKNEKKGPVSHLHQSDLLVLDYQLDRTSKDGTQAIEIIRRLMGIDHFNLVIVYTNQPIDKVYETVRWGLLGPHGKYVSSAERKEAVDLIEAAEDAAEDSNVSNIIESAINSEQYFHSRLHFSTYLRTMARRQGPYKGFFELCDELGWDNEQKKLILRYSLGELEESHQKEMHHECPEEEIKWSSSDIKWWKSDSVFVCFSNKRDDDDLLEELQMALYDWSPNPSRLFLANLRSIMDEQGVVSQKYALENEHALAYWYWRLLQASDTERRWLVAEAVARHSEQLMNIMLPSVEKFAMRLVEAESGKGEANELCKSHFRIDLSNVEKKKLAALEHNSLVCSKDPEGWHLTTGQVFVMCETYWLCLSPACDMVPRNGLGWRGPTFGKWLPFMAIELQKAKNSTALRDAQSNNYIFLRVEEKVQAYGFSKSPKDGASPQWHVLYAKNGGRFEEGNRKISVLKIESEETELVTKAHSACVVNQLRYEYALNLLQQLGVSQIRVGLDFVDQAG